MTGFTVQFTTVHVGNRDYQIRSLSDRRQFSDPDGEAERAGISSANWPMFGMLWSSARVLAEAMTAFPVVGKRILEVGCGLGLTSLVLHARGADITASDHHPLAPEFLKENALLNGLSPVPYCNVPWEGPNPGLGTFDVIVGSDVLYERSHVALLAGLLASHANPVAEIVVTDPGRGHGNAFKRALTEQGYVGKEERSAFETGSTPPFKGRILTFSRGYAKR